MTDSRRARSKILTLPPPIYLSGIPYPANQATESAAPLVGLRHDIDGRIAVADVHARKFRLVALRIVDVDAFDHIGRNVADCRHHVVAEKLAAVHEHPLHGPALRFDNAVGHLQPRHLADQRPGVGSERDFVGRGPGSSAYRRESTTSVPAPPVPRSRSLRRRATSPAFRDRFSRPKSAARAPKPRIRAKSRAAATPRPAHAATAPPRRCRKPHKKESGRYRPASAVRPRPRRPGSRVTRSTRRRCSVPFCADTLHTPVRAASRKSLFIIQRAAPSSR